MFRLLGPDGDTLRELGNEVRAVLAGVPGVTHTQASMIGGQPKLWLDVDEHEARERGWSLRHLADRTQAHLDGMHADRNWKERMNCRCASLSGINAVTNQMC